MVADVMKKIAFHELRPLQSLVDQFSIACKFCFHNADHVMISTEFCYCLFSS